MTRYIAIDGSGGSGKTYLSNKLADAMNAQVFHLDKYGSDFVPFVGLPVLRRLIGESTDEIVIYEGVGVFDKRFDDLNPFKIFVDGIVPGPPPPIVCPPLTVAPALNGPLGSGPMTSVSESSRTRFNSVTSLS